MKKNKIRVLYINHETHGEGGSTASLLNLIHSVSDDIEPIVLVRSKENAQNFEKVGICCIYYPFSQNVADTNKIRGVLNFIPRMLRDFYLDKKCVRNIAKSLREYKIDIVHSNSSIIRIGLPIARLLNAKSVVHLREFLNLDFNTKPFWGWKSVEQIISKSNYVIAITQAIYTHWNVGSLNNNSAVIWNAVRSLNSVSPVCENKEKYILFCASRVTESKGIFDAVEIFCKSQSSQLGYTMKIIGRADDITKGKILHLAEMYNVNKGKIEFMGYRTDIDIIMHKASVFLMSSKNEALGRVTIEAMFSGCPVIGRNSGGTKELIRHGENGFLYNNVDEGVKYLEDILTQPDLSEHFITKGRIFAINNFSEEIYGKKIISVYKQLVTK